MALVLLVPSACRGEAPGRRDILDGAPRRPSDEGVATTLTFRGITLDGSRSYSISPDLIAFSTYTLQLEPLLAARGQYVQVGVKGRTVMWMARLGGVVRTSRGRRAFYDGVLTRYERDRAVFRDGTVLRLGARVPRIEVGVLVEAEIDVGTHRVEALTVRGSPPPASLSPSTGR